MTKIGPEKFVGYRIDVLDTKSSKGIQEVLNKWRQTNPPAPLKVRYDGKDPQNDKYCTVCCEQYYDASFYLNHMRIEHKDMPLIDSVGFPALAQTRNWVAMQDDRKTFTQLGETIPFWLRKWYTEGDSRSAGAPLTPRDPVELKQDVAAKRGDNVDLGVKGGSPP